MREVVKGSIKSSKFEREFKKIDSKFLKRLKKTLKIKSKEK